MISENTKVTLTIAQLRELVNESLFDEPPFEDMSDAIRTMFYWIESNTNFEIRAAKSPNPFSSNWKVYQLWGKPEAFTDQPEFNKEVRLIRTQLDLLGLDDYLIFSLPKFEFRNKFSHTKEFTCKMAYSKKYAFDFNEFKRDTRPKDNINWQNRWKINRIVHEPDPADQQEEELPF